MSPGSVRTGAIQTTSFITALQRGHVRVPCLFSKSDTNAFPSPHMNPNAGQSYRLRRIALFDPKFRAMELRLNQGPLFGFHAHPNVPRRHNFDGETIRQMGIAFEVALV